MSTFGSNNEIIEMRKRADNIFTFLQDISDAPNYINIYKKFFPKWLYESVLRRIGVNKWKLRQSKISKHSFIKELQLDHIASNDNGMVYYPKHGYEDLCNKILDDGNIEIEKIDISKVKKIMPENKRGRKVVLMDNRIDYVCGYIFGNLSRIDISTQVVDVTDIKTHDEFQCIDIGPIITPYKDYWAISHGWHKCVKIFSNLMDKEKPHSPSLIQPTMDNVKMLAEYVDLVKMYPGKSFVFPKSMTVLL
jgi:UDP-galactopyranose mutase